MRDMKCWKSTREPFAGQNLGRWLPMAGFLIGCFVRSVSGTGSPPGEVGRYWSLLVLNPSHENRGHPPFFDKFRRMNVLYITANPPPASDHVPTEGWFRLLRERGLRPVLVSHSDGG